MTLHSRAAKQPIKMDLDVLGYWDDDANLYFIATEELGLAQATVMDDSQAMELIRQWYAGDLTLEAPTSVPLAAIHASIQGVVRLDVLRFYLAHPDRTYDSDPSSWRAQGPLAVTVRPGRTVLVDGTHRWASARIRGEQSFSAQILRTADGAS
ncbi:hypothetical protein C5C39_09705 [Rathayibacter sp. AY1F3]|uniref:hypothetical protein n=1 Tax=Rathayibacter sp. AY1F3 TaxID=2080558 RepID=UPI000CE770AB|nr:hypothetical protein [Rathayibacter sp. AY1F3]PPG90867.1 hypothetical protein C5C39_09705 [Rathayibacter sp. AY1F3]